MKSFRLLLLGLGCWLSLTTAPVSAYGPRVAIGLNIGVPAYRPYYRPCYGYGYPYYYGPRPVVYVQPAPVVVQEQPIYVQPAPVVQQVYPAPVVQQPGISPTPQVVTQPQQAPP